MYTDKTIDENQRGTNFILGYDDSVDSSVYTKGKTIQLYIQFSDVLSITIDFHGKFRGRAPIAADFPDSKVLLDFIRVNNPGIMCSFLVHWVHVLQVMHEFPVVGKSSTSVSRQDFIKHKLEPGRLQNFRKIEVISSDY